MTKMIKLTNTGIHLGEPIWINPKLIACVYSTPSGEGGSLQTRVYGGPTGVEWVVEESPETVIRHIEYARGYRL